MTLKTSLFNKGIYKSTVKRYLWGSVLYFIILFMSTVLPIVLMLNYDSMYFTENSVLYSDGFIVSSVIIAMFVPTIVGVLVFRFIHSKKASIFTHGLPVNRTSVYISTLLASFTLMMAPILLNGLCILILSLTAYSEFITIGSCFVWIGMNLLALFLMFSCTCLVANLTGNSFATVGLNALLHGIVPMIMVAINAVAKCFLYGFTEMNDTISRIVGSNFIIWLGNTADDISYNGYSDMVNAVDFEFGRMIAYIIISLIFYVLGWLIYKKRNIETAEDIAGFKILNPIFKYLVTFIGTIGAFAVFSEIMSYSVVIFGIIIVTISVVIYFASEMMLKKTLKVWKAYKGFLGFAAIFALSISFLAFTDFFGYENYVPNAYEVESVAVYNYYNDNEPFIKDENVKEHIVTIHEEFLNSHPRDILNPSLTGGYYTRIHFVYNMDNGDVKERTYLISESEKYDILNELYLFDEYKKMMEKPFTLPSDDLLHINLYSQYAGKFTITDMEEMKSLYSCIRRDVEQLDYRQIYPHNLVESSIGIEYRYENEELDIRKAIESIGYVDYPLNNNFKNTIKWFEENGYSEYVRLELEAPLYVIRDVSFTREMEDIEQDSIEFEGTVHEDKPVRIENEKIKEKVLGYFDESYTNYYPDKSYYYVIYPADEFNYSYNVVGMIEADNVQKFTDYLK